jgi:multicomponent Na+:H+ antiporter subunit E
VSTEAPGPRLRHQFPLLVWLVVVWILLWGTWSWANLLSGAAVALAVTLLLPLPPVVGSTPVRPLPLIRFVGHFLVDLAVSGAQVAWRAIGPGGVRQGAIVRVQLRVDSDLLLDREERLIAVHLLHVHDRADVERQKRDVLATEDRIVRAFGTAADIASLGTTVTTP